jgi:hypothetical protein
MKSLRCFAIAASLVLPATATEGIWLTDHPQHKPSLAYPAAYTFTYQMIGYGFLTHLDRKKTNFNASSFDNFLDGFRDGPHFDDDEWQWNYVAHPLWGSETYLRARGQGFDPIESFLFSAGASFVWEFGIESWSARPSIQDLVITPVAGMLLGELRFRLKRQLIERGDYQSAIWLVLIDPIQYATEWIGEKFGRDWSEPAFRKVDPRLPLHQQGLDHVPVSIDIARIGRKPGVMVRWSIPF